MIYIATFLLATLIGHEASKSTGTKKLVLCMMSIVPLCLLAGLRLETIGTDVQVYAQSIYNRCASGPISIVFGVYTQTEPLFLIYAWITTNVFKDFVAYLFCLQLAVALPVAYFLYREYPRNIGSGMFVYSFIFYGLTLNAMRQGIAAAILLFAFLAARNNKPLRFAVLLVISAGFHLTGLFGVLLWPIARVFSLDGSSSPTDRRQQALMRFFCIFFSLLVLILIFTFGEKILLAASTIRDSYSYQIEHMGKGSSNNTVIALATLATALYFFLSRKHQEDPGNRYGKSSSYLAVICLSAAMSQFSIISPELARIGTMFLVFSVPFFADLLANGETREDKGLVYFAMVGVCVCYFLYIYVHGGSGEIYPYASSVVPWLNSFGSI